MRRRNRRRTEIDDAWQWDMTTILALALFAALLLLASAEMWWWHLDGPL